MGNRLDKAGWRGPALGHFAPSGHAGFLPVASTQLTLFAWNNGASPATVRTGALKRHYSRGKGVMDIMAVNQQAQIAHDRPESPGDCLVVALPVDDDVRMASLGLRRAPSFTSRFGFKDPLLHALATALQVQCVQREPLGRIYTDAISVALLSHVVAHYAERPAVPECASVPRHGGSTLSARQKTVLVSYIETHLVEDIGLDDLAAQLQYGRAQFVRLFRKAFSTSPHQYVLSLRIEYAKRLLGEDDRPIADIATACGFADQSHFGNCFARVVGLPPGRFRKRLRKSETASVTPSTLLDLR